MRLNVAKIRNERLKQHGIQEVENSKFGIYCIAGENFEPNVHLVTRKIPTEGIRQNVDL